jgi:hypothetical protein
VSYLRPTKAVIQEFPKIEQELLKRYSEYKNKKSVLNLAGLAIMWGQWATYKELFQLDTKISNHLMTEIYFAVTEHHPDLIIY